MTDTVETTKAAKKPRAKTERVSMSKKAFDAAVTLAAQQAASEVEARFHALLQEKRAELGDAAAPISAGGDMDMMRKLALAIGEISDQTGNRMIVAPAELEARANARAQMETAIIDAYAKGMTATYELRGKIYLDEQLIDPTWIDADRRRRVTSIDWDGVPNEQMVPVNDTAKIIFGLFKRSIGGNTPEAKVPYKKASERAGLRVHGQNTARDTVPEVSQPRSAGGGLKVHRPMPEGTVQEVAVLGTVASPARQLAA